MHIDRRTLLKCVVAVAAANAFGCGKDDGDGEQLGEESLDAFPGGVASGDPRPTSVVLWTRALPPGGGAGDARVRLEVALDADFKQRVLDLRDLVAATAHDNAVKVKVTGLTPRTTYYYRFIRQGEDRPALSALGRTRTAPAADADVPVRFAVASCQDFVGRYYNSWQLMLERDEDLDFVVFLGDYVYETTGDPSFQAPGSTRVMRFTDEASAIPLGVPSQRFFAARSVSNYRDLYRTVRTDTVLRQAHARYPFVLMWDDHEFSDDSHGDVATYTDGVRNEEDAERKRNAEQVFYEHQPVDPLDQPAGALDPDDLPRFPDTRSYRSLAFGKNVKLVATDERTFRPDHLIPEDAYPGRVALDAAALSAIGLTSAFASDTFAYVNIDDSQYAAQRSALRAAWAQLAREDMTDATDAQLADRAALNVNGNVALAYANPVLQAIDPVLVISPTGKPRGLAFVHMGKQTLFADIGARYVVVKDTYDVYAGALFAQTQGKSEDVYGATQEGWLRQEVLSGEAWKVLVSSVSLTSMMWDLRNRGLTGPEAQFAQRFYVNVDQYDGFPNKRKQLTDYLKQQAAQVKNALFISGDIHASFASVENGVPCVTASAISSFTLKAGIGPAVEAVVGKQSNVYRYAVTQMEQTFQEANPGLAFAECTSNGYAVVEVQSATEALATFQMLPAELVTTDYTGRGAELAGLATVRRFRIQGGAVTGVS